MRPAVMPPFVGHRKNRASTDNGENVLIFKRKLQRGAVRGGVQRRKNFLFHPERPVFKMRGFVRFGQRESKLAESFDGYHVTKKNNFRVFKTNYLQKASVPSSVILLVFLSSCIHAVWNYWAKTIPSGAPFIWLVATVTSVLYAPLIIWHLIVYGFESSFLNWVFLLGTAIIHLVYFLFLQKGYQVGDLSVVYPLARGSGPLFATLGAMLFFQEKLAGLPAVGLGLVVLGVFLVAGLANASFQNTRTKTGVFYGIVTGMLIAGYTLWDNYAVRTLLISPLLVDYVSHPFRVAALAGVAKNRWPETRNIWENYRWKILAIGAVSPIPFIIVLYVLQTAPVSYVAPARELSIVIGVILGARLLTEQHFKSRLIGSLLIVAGIGLLSFQKG